MTEDRKGSEGESGHPHTYRCPVCSHVDSVPLEGEERARIRCTHCRTELVVRILSEDRERMEVKLAGEGDGTERGP